MQRIVVLAGTPVDTEMGAAFLNARGMRGLPVATAQTPEEQNILQMFEHERLQRLCRDSIREGTAQGAQAAFMYCNSLSCALDIDRLQDEIDVPLITPLAAYARIVPAFDFIGLLAANGQALHGLEGVIIREKPTMRILGASLLPVVIGIESGLAPELLVGRFGLPELCAGFAKAGAQCILLGCTHFPSLAASLSGRISLPVIDPAQIMFEMLNEALKNSVSNA